MLKPKSSSSTSTLCLTIQQTMYPKVKVRALEQDDEFEHSRSPLQGFNALSIRDYTTPEKGVKQNSSASVAKVPESYVPRSITPPPSFPKSVMKSESTPEGNKPNIRASSIPRPRAVVSSPDNDQLLGSKKSKLQRPSSVNSALKRHDLSQSRHSEGRYSQTTTTKKHDSAQSRQLEGRYIRTNTSSKKPLTNNVHKEATLVNAKKGSAVDVRVPKTNITKAKPCFMTT